jgi:hypothetical protein
MLQVSGAVAQGACGVTAGHALAFAAGHPMRQASTTVGTIT